MALFYLSTVPKPLREPGISHNVPRIAFLIARNGVLVSERVGGRNSILDIRLLGPPEVSLNGDPIEVDTRKAIALLAYLSVEGDATRDTLATLFWADSPSDRARATLRRTLSALRSGIGSDAITADRGAWSRIFSSLSAVLVSSSWACAASATSSRARERTRSRLSWRNHIPLRRVYRLRQPPPLV